MSAFCSSETVIFYFVLGTEHCRTGRPVAMLALATCASTPTATAVSFGGVPAHHIFKAPLGLVGSSNCSLLRSHRLTITTVTATAKTVGINSVDPAVAALDSEALNSTYPAGKRSAHKKYYFVVANATFMLDEEEHFKELLFERLRNYRERSKEQDFWLVIEPKFLNKFPDITRRLRRPAVALVSTNGPWITFMKLRLDRVLSKSYDAGNLEEALASDPVNLEFKRPDNWVAPYPKYEFGWWKPFLPPGSKESKI